MKKIYMLPLFLLLILVIEAHVYSQTYPDKSTNPWQWVEAPGFPDEKVNYGKKLPCLPPNPTSLTCGNTATFNLAASGYTGSNATTTAGSCGQCCFSGSDLDCDGQQDVSYSVENSKWYKYCNNTGATQTISLTADEPGTGGTCNIQGAVWIGANLDATTLNCNNTGFQEFGSNPGGGADGFILSNVTIPNGQCAYVMVDGYGGAQCTGVGLTANCPTCTSPTSANAGTDVSICEGSSITLTGSYAGGTGTPWRKWSTGSTTINSGAPGSSTATVSPTSTTTYTYTVCLDGVGTTCCVSDQVVVNVTPTFTPNAGADVTICPGGSSTLGSSPTGPAGSTYSWACAPCDADITLSSASVANPTINIAGGGAGSATYTVTVTNGACIKTDVVVVTIGAVVANAGADNSVCPGAGISLGGTPTGPAGSTYSWSCTANCDPDVTLSSSAVANPTLSVSASQTAAISPVYSVTVTLGSCAPVVDAVAITVNALPATPSPTASVSPICAGTGSTLSVAALAGHTFSWWTASTGGTNLGSGTSLAVTPLVTTTYYVQSTNTTTGCTGIRGSVTVTVNPTPVASAGIDQEQCLGGTFALLGSCADCGSCSPNQTWSIISGTGTFSPDVNTLNSTFTPTSAGTISLKLIPCDPGGCSPVADTIFLTVNPAPAVSASIDNDTICENLITILDASASGGTPFPATIVPTTFNSTSSSAAIIDGTNAGGGTCSTQTVIPISVSGISSANVGSGVTVSICLNVSHPKVKDLEVVLCAPGGSPCITLVLKNSLGNGANYTSTCFDDISLTDILTGTAPFTGIFNPQGTVAFTDLDGASTNGTWTLAISDCKGSSVGTFDNWSITISEPVVINPYTYAWTSTSGVSDPDSATTYYSSFGVPGPANITKTVTVTDSKGCTDTATVATYIDAATATISGGGNACSGDSVLINIALTGSSPWDITYDIDGVSQPPVTGILSSPFTMQATTAGIYTVSAVSDNFCNGTPSGSATVIINSSPAPSISSSSPVSFCQGGSVILDAGVFTSYLWSNGAISQTINANSSGTYTVTVTSSGCTGTATKTVNVNPNPTPTITPGGPTTFCQGGNVTLDAGNYSSYLWSTSATTQSINVTTDGIYTVTVTDDSSCTGTDTQTITVNPNPTPVVTTNGPVSFCDGGSVTLNAGAFSSYSWSTGAVSQTIIVDSSGTFTVTVTNASFCTGTTSSTVNVNPNPTAVITPDGAITFCQGGSITLDAGIFSSYSWSTTATTQSINVISGGTYSVSVTNDSSCTGTASLLVTVNSNPVAVITPSPSLNFCPGETVTLTSDPASTYLWSTGSNIQSIDITTGGTFSVSVTNGAGCIDSTSVTTSVSSAILLTTASENSSCGQPDGSVSVAASGSGPFTYLWNTSPTQTTDTATGLIAGNYTVTVTDNNGCTEIASAGISDFGGPVPSFTVTGINPFCQGDSVILSSSAADSYLWSSGETTQSIVVKNSGDYSVSVIISGCSGTSTDTTITVFLNPSPVITSTGPVSFCQGGNVTLNAGGGFSNYLWSTSGTSQTVNVNSIGTYIVTVTNSDGCAGIATQVINVNPDPTPSITAGGAISFCQGNSVILDAGNFTSYSWSSGQTSQTINAASSATYSVTVTNDSSCTGIASIPVNVNSNPVVTVTPDGPTTFCQGGDVNLDAGLHTSYLWSTTGNSQTINVASAGIYSVTVTNDSACQAIASLTVTVNLNPVPSITPSGPTTFCSGGNVILDAGNFSSYLWSTNDTSQTINASTSGTYVVTVTNSDACSATDSVDVSVSSSLTPAISPNGPVSFCQGDSVTLDAGTGYSTYLWSTSSTSQTITVLTDGIYSVIVTDASSCTGNDTIEITVNLNPTASISGNPLSLCQGDSVLLTANSASSYLWNNGATSQSTYASSPGDFVVTITDANGCEDASDTSNVVVNSIPDASTSASGPTTFCQGGTVTLSALATSGLVWNNGGTSQNIVVSSSGSYIVTVTDGNGCSAVSIPIVVTVNQNPTPSITPSASINFCQGDSISLTSSAGSSYLWNTGDTTQTIVVIAAGNYIVTMTNSSGCMGISPVLPVSIFSNPTPTVDNDTSIICSGISITLDAGSGYTEYLWNTTEINQTITISTTGTYEVTVTDANGCKGVSAPVSIFLDQPLPLSLNLATSTATCGNANGEATAGVSGGTTPYSFLWSVGQTDSTATGLSAGTYSVTVSDFLGCTQTSSVSVSTIGGPSVIITGVDDVNCFGGSDGQATASVSGIAPFSFMWSNSQSDSGIVGLTAGTYFVTISDSAGCVIIDSVVINQPNVFSASANFTNTTCGQINGSVSALPTGGTPPYSYLWSSGCISPTCTGLSATIYFVTITDSNGCEVSDSAIVSSSNGASVSVTSFDVTCYGEASGAATANPTGGTPPYSYLWNDSSATQTATGLVAGSYEVTVTDSSGCETIATITVVQPAELIAGISSTNISCSGGTNGSATANATGGITNYSYLWSGGQISQTISGLSEGSYTVTVTDSNGCISTKSISITSPSPLTTVAFPTTECGASTGKATSTVSDGTSPYTFNWSDGQAGSSATGLAPGNYTVTVTDFNNCTDTGYVTISSAPIPMVSTSNDTTIMQESVVSISAAGSGGASPFTYLWSTVPPETSASISVSPEETTYFIVTVTNTEGCSKIDTVKIEVQNKYVIFIPSMFSPNNDNQNDVLYIRGLGIKEINFAVFDRWGEKVYNTGQIAWTGDKTVYWDGKFKGKDLNSAVFVYVLNAVLDNGDIVERKGNITLVK